MKLKHLIEYNLKSQDFPNTKQYEYIETENYIFLKLDKEQNYLLYNLGGLISTEESNNYLNNMVVPSKINKNTLIDFFDTNHEYFTRINKNKDNESFNFNNLKKIFNKNHAACWCNTIVYQTTIYNKRRIKRNLRSIGFNYLFNRNFVSGSG